MTEILKTIRESFEFFDLKENWDDEGALPVDPKTYTRMMELLFRIINAVGNIESPEINLCRDGSIDLDWGVKTNPRLLINITAYEISWYGNTENNREINNNQSELYNKELFEWIYDNLKTV